LKILPKFKRCRGNEQGAAILGAHVEGPFISKLKHGAHNLFNIKSLENSNLTDTYGSLDNIGIVTLAPELNGSMEAIKLLSSNGIVVSLGHTSSDMETSIQAVKNGATFITHLFNAMLSVGILWFYNNNYLNKLCL
jgi:N-acetylglucosamine-6-phosphate deacetylase